MATDLIAALWHSILTTGCRTLGLHNVTVPEERQTNKQMWLTWIWINCKKINFCFTITITKFLSYYYKVLVLLLQSSCLTITMFLYYYYKVLVLLLQSSCITITKFLSYYYKVLVLLLQSSCLTITKFLSYYYKVLVLLLQSSCLTVTKILYYYYKVLVLLLQSSCLETKCLCMHCSYQTRRKLLSNDGDDLISFRCGRKTS